MPKGEFSRPSDKAIKKMWDQMGWGEQFEHTNKSNLRHGRASSDLLYAMAEAARKREEEEKKRRTGGRQP